MSLSVSFVCGFWEMSSKLLLKLKCGVTPSKGLLKIGKISVYQYLDNFSGFFWQRFCGSADQSKCEVLWSVFPVLTEVTLTTVVIHSCSNEIFMLKT